MARKRFTRERTGEHNAWPEVARTFALGLLLLASAALSQQPDEIERLIESGDTAHKAGLPEQGFEFYERALELATSRSDTAMLLRVRDTLGKRLLWADRFDEAETYLLRNVEVWRNFVSRDIADVPDFVFSYDFDFAEQVSNHLDRSLFAAGNLRLAQKRYAEAAALFEEIKLEALGADLPLGISLFNLGDLDGAEAALERAIPTEQNRPADGFFGRLYRSLFSASPIRWLQLVELARAEGAGRLEPDGSISEASDRRERSLAAARAALAWAERGRAEALDQKVGGWSLGADELISVAPRLDSTLVLYTVIYEHRVGEPVHLFAEDLTVDQILAYVVTPDGDLHTRRIPASGTVEEMLRATRTSLGVRGRGLKLVASSGEASDSQLRRLYDLLVAPIAAWLPAADKGHVILVPQDGLALVPFAALSRPDGDDFIDHHSFSLAPSISFLHSILEEPRSYDTGRVLLVGDPEMPSLRGPDGRSASLAPLPGARLEVRHVGRLLDAEPLLGREATKPAVIARMPGARILHFATHGLLEGATLHLGSLALARRPGRDSLLSAREIAFLDLHAELVVLSACDTSGGEVSVGDGLASLTYAFMASGVPSVLASLWSVSDESTVLLMDTFYRELLAGRNKAQALRRAMLTTREAHPAPAYWSAFTLFGDPRATQSLAGARGDSQAVPVADAFRQFVLPLPDDALPRDDDLPTPSSDDTLMFRWEGSREELLRFYLDALGPLGFDQAKSGSAGFSDEPVLLLQRGGESVSLRFERSAFSWMPDFYWLSYHSRP